MSDTGATRISSQNSSSGLSEPICISYDALTALAAISYAATPTREALSRIRLDFDTDGDVGTITAVATDSYIAARRVVDARIPKAWRSLLVDATTFRDTVKGLRRDARRAAADQQIELRLDDHALRIGLDAHSVALPVRKLGDTFFPQIDELLDMDMVAVHPLATFDPERITRAFRTIGLYKTDVAHHGNVRIGRHDTDPATAAMVVDQEPTSEMRTAHVGVWRAIIAPRMTHETRQRIRKEDV